MFSMITNIYNKRTKGPTLMELFTATGKLKKVFFDNQRCSTCAPRVTRHTSIRYSSFCHTHVDVCGKNSNIISMCAVSPVVHKSNIFGCQKKNFFSFLVGVNNSIKVGPLVSSSSSRCWTSRCSRRGRRTSRWTRCTACTEWVCFGQITLNHMRVEETASPGCQWPYESRGFLVINVCNHGEHYEISCIIMSSLKNKCLIDINSMLPCSAATCLSYYMASYPRQLSLHIS